MASIDDYIPHTHSLHLLKDVDTYIYSHLAVSIVNIIEGKNEQKKGRRAEADYKFDTAAIILESLTSLLETQQFQIQPSRYPDMTQQLAEYVKLMPTKSYSHVSTELFDFVCGLNSAVSFRTTKYRQKKQQVLMDFAKTLLHNRRAIVSWGFLVNGDNIEYRIVHSRREFKDFETALEMYDAQIQDEKNNVKACLKRMPQYQRIIMRGIINHLNS